MLNHRPISSPETVAPRWLTAAKLGAILVGSPIDEVQAGTNAITPSPVTSKLTPAPAGGRAFDGQLAVALVRKMLAEIENANDTGNYSVLHGLGTTSFQSSVSVQNLSGQIAALREGNVHLISALLPEPIFTTPLIVGADNTILLRGLLQTQPLQTQFSFRFAWEAGGWRITDLSVSVNAEPIIPPSEPVAVDPAAPKPPTPASAKVPTPTTDW